MQSIYKCVIMNITDIKIQDCVVLKNDKAQIFRVNNVINPSTGIIEAIDVDGHRKLLNIKDIEYATPINEFTFDESLKDK